MLDLVFIKITFYVNLIFNDKGISFSMKMYCTYIIFQFINKYFFLFRMRLEVWSLWTNLNFIVKKFPYLYYNIKILYILIFLIFCSYTTSITSKIICPNFDRWLETSRAYIFYSTYYWFDCLLHFIILYIFFITFLDILIFF